MENQVKLEQLKKILTKASSLEKGKEIGLAKEFISLDEKITNVDEKLSDLTDELKKKLEEELVYEVDENKIVESVLAKVEIPEPIKGDKGEPGKKGDKGDTTIVEKVIEKTIVEKPITIDKTITEIKEVAVTDTGDVIVGKINQLEITPENQIDFSHIKNVPKFKNGNYYGGSLIKEIIAGSGIEVDNTNLGYPVISAPGSTTDEKVKYNASDASAGYLADKVVAGTGITLSEGTGGDVDKLLITNTLDLSGYVPYTGATTDVYLGAYNLTSTDLYATGRIGAGTVTPDTTLHAVGGISGAIGTRVAQLEGNLPELLFKDTSDNTGFSISKYGNQVYFVKTNGSGVYGNYAGMMQLSTGAWTIGSGSNPLGTLYVYGSGGVGFYVQSNHATSINSVFKGYTSQTGNLTEWRDSSDTVLASVDADGNFDVPNIQVNGTFNNYNSLLPDIGSVQNSDARGYGLDYITDKSLNNVWVGSNGAEEEGGMRVVNGTFQMYLNGGWEDVVTNFVFREDPNFGYTLEHAPIGFTEYVEIMTGQSLDNLGMNGYPITNAYQTAIGAYGQVPVIGGYSY